MSWLIRFILGVSVILAASAAYGTVVDDFSSGVQHAVSPSPGDYATWYDVSIITWANAVSASLNGSAAMRITDEWTNGIYRIYHAAVPTSGYYQLSADMYIDDASAPNAIRQYQVGVVVNGGHRGDALHAVDTALPGRAVGNYQGLTTGDDSGLAIQTVTTGTFYAAAGSDLLVVFSTDVQTKIGDIGGPTPPDPDAGVWNGGSYAWGSDAVYVDNITLLPEPAGLALLALGAVGLARRRRR